MVIVPDSFLKANYGEAFVTFLLSTECLVRTTTSDIGVDLYCESVVDARPFSHFWVQVKTGDQLNVISKGKRASYSFDTGYLAYWRKQPIPIFAALVPQHQWPPSTELKPALNARRAGIQIPGQDLQANEMDCFNGRNRQPPAGKAR